MERFFSSRFRIWTKTTTIRTKANEWWFYIFTYIRPARTEPATPRLLPLNPFTATSSSGTVSVNEPDHGRSTSDTVRFRDSEAVGGIPAATINASGGFTITVTNDNNYTFAAGATATFTEKGGGGSVSAGPVTQQA